MEFNYGREKKKFDENWEQLRKEYREAGMAEESIQAMHEYDWEQFKKERIWCQHNQYLDTIVMCVNNQIWETSEDANPLYYKFLERISYNFTEEDFSDEYAWMETLEDPQIYDAVLSLDDKDKRFLTLRVIDDLTLEEIAGIYNVSVVAVHNQLTRIIKKIKNFLK